MQLAEMGVLMDNRVEHKDRSLNRQDLLLTAQEQNQ